MQAGRRYAALIVNLIEGTLLAGALFGWPSLVYVLQDDQLYASLCEVPNTTNVQLTQNFTFTPKIQNISREDRFGEGVLFHDDHVPGRCLAQKVYLSDAYTGAIMAYGLSALPMGLVFDRFGLRITRSIIVCLGVIANLLVAFAEAGSEWLVFLGAAGIGISGYGLIMTGSHVALLSEDKSSTVMAVFMGGVDTCFAYSAVKIAHDHGVSRRDSLVFIAGLWCLVLISTWFLLPTFKVNDEGQSQVMEMQELISVESNLKLSRNEKSTSGKSACRKSVTFEEWSLRTSVVTLDFTLFMFWFSTNHVQIQMMNNMFDAWMTDIVGGDLQKVGFFTNALAYGNLFAIVPSPLSGLITDGMRARFGAEAGDIALTLVPALSLGSVINITVTVFMLFHSELAIYGAIIFYILSKPIFYATASSYVALLFPTEQFGVIFGLTYAIGGVSSIIMYLYFIWIAHTQSFFPVNITILVTLLLSLALPLRLVSSWWRHLDAEQEKQALIPRKDSGFCG